MFPPKKQLRPVCFNISYIIDVVVVFPSVPVTPITLHGASFNTISISDVNNAPLSTSSTNSGIVGNALGDLKITSNPCNLVSQMNQSQLLHWIDMVSFAVVEITEYLDTHPDDEEALKYFNHYADLRRTALRAYAQNYTPLTIDTANPDNYWRWASDPWPWEGGDC